jgi:hypothetical protein
MIDPTRARALIERWRAKDKEQERDYYGTGAYGECADELEALLFPEGPDPEFTQLVSDHSVALECVREIASGECPIDCGHCIICRAHTFLFSPPAPSEDRS